MNFATLITGVRWLAGATIVVALAASLAVTAATANVYAPGAHLSRDRPHPAVARVIVPEGDVTSFGSGTLVDVRDQFGLVITNWHVVRDSKGEVEVVFPDGFRSKARPLKVDADWDLAALVIWRPPAAPVPIAPLAPQSGDQLTICGYGQGQYRAVTGRCTQYYAPKENLPQHMVELDVEARQGDSGGPIFNDRGELAGVLFGAGGGTTLGSFGGRVGSFLATLAPDIGQAADAAVAQANDVPVGEPVGPPVVAVATIAAPAAQPAALWTDKEAQPHVDNAGWQAAPPPIASTRVASYAVWFEQTKTVLAAVGVVAIMLQVLRVVR
jgi:hypothetical protein